MFRHQRRVHYFLGSGISQKRNARRRAIIVVSSLMFVLAVIAYLIWRDTNKIKPINPVSTKPVTSNYTIESNVFTTPYFELETKKSWQFKKEDSNANTFVYVDMRHKLAQGELRIYVDQKPKDLYTRGTYLLSVRQGSDGFLKQVAPVSDHCNTKAPSKNKVGEEVFVFNNVSFKCDNDATWFAVLVGLDGGSTAMNLKRPNGSTATYYIHYLGSTAFPVKADVEEVIRKFKVL